MATLDWLFFGILTLSLALGAWRGLVYEVFSLASWAVAFVLAQWLGADVGQRLPMGNTAEPLRYAAGFAVVFVLAVFTGGLVSALLQKLFTAIGLRPVDRVLGAVFGLLRGLVLLLAITMVVGMTPLRDSAAWQASTAAGWSTALLKVVAPLLPAELAKYLPAV